MSIAQEGHITPFTVPLPSERNAIHADLWVQEVHHEPCDTGQECEEQGRRYTLALPALPDTRVRKAPGIEEIYIY